MKSFKGGSRTLLLLVYGLILLAFFFPFLTRTTDDGAYARRFSGYTLMNGLPEEEAAAVPSGDFSHLYALLLLCVAVGGGVAMLDRDSRRKYIAGLAGCAAGLGLSAYLLANVGGVYPGSAEGVSVLPSVTDRAGWGLKAVAVLFAVGFALSARYLLRIKSAPHHSSSTALVTRVAVLGAVASILYVVPEIPVIPPIYKLDLSGVPVLLAGFSMGGVPALGVLLIKDLTGLLHTSSMGVGELADFLTGAAFVLTASAVYRRAHTFKGAVLSLGVGSLCMTLVAVLANY